MNQLINEQMDFERLVPDRASPGQMLKMAREIRKLSQVDIAQQMNLREQWIIDIENDNYNAAAALIYIKGYLQSYARLVGISAEKVLGAFKEMKFDENFSKRKPQVNTDEHFAKRQSVFCDNSLDAKTHRSKSTKWTLWGTIFILLLVAVLAVTKFSNPRTINNKQQSASIELNDTTAELNTVPTKQAKSSKASLKSSSLSQKVAIQN